MFRTLALGLLALTAGAQTQVDLRTQAKGIDFTAATSTKPVKTGAVLPASCATGEMFFKTDAPAGANLYACTAANTWSAQGGSGPSSCQDRGAVNAYACSPTPAVASYAVGTSYWFRASTSTTGAATVNFNGLGAKPILKQYNQPLAAGDIKAGQWVMVTYDGTAMQMQSQTATAESAVSSVFGRTGDVAPATGDYTTAQVTENGNLYFTIPRAQAAFSYPGVVKVSAGALDCPTCITAATAADTDLYGTFPHLSVVKLQGRSVASAPPIDQQYLGWNGGLSQWEPKTLPAQIPSVFGRTGPVTAQYGDYSFAQISGTSTAAQLPTTVMRTDRDNTITAGTQNMSAAAHTLPMKSGGLASRPAACSVGETYFATDAPAGANVYGCTAANIWSVQGAQTVQSDGVTVGTRAATNFTTGPGLLSLASDTGSQIEMLWALDTAVNQTQPGEQSGAALWCASDSASSASYACSLTPTAGAYTTGMTLHWRPDVNGAGGPTTLNIDTLGAAPVKLSDGTSDPTPADIVAGRLYDVWYDGVKFRLAPTTAAAVGAVGDTGVNGILYRGGSGVGSAATADQMSGPFFCQDTASTAGAYACNLTPAIGGYGIGTTYWFRANTTNSGAATVSFNSLGAKTIKKQSNVSLAPGDITPGQWVMITYDGTNMQMLSQAPSAAGGAVSSVFGRAGAVTAAAGDYTTAQVPESGNLYYTDARAQAALTWSTLTGKPSTFAPAAHAASHQAGGSDEIAVAAPAANAIPKAGAAGTLAGGWLPTPGASSLGGVRAMDCSATGLVQKINADGTVTCAAAGGGSTPSINTVYLKYEDDFTCGFSGSACLPWFSNGTGQVNNAANGAWPHLGVFNIGGSAASAGNLGYLMLANYQNPYTGLGTFGGLLANGPWELHWIFRLNQTTNTKMAIGAHNSGTYGYDGSGIGVRFNTVLGDTTFMLIAEDGWGGGVVSSGIAADTSWHHLKIYWVSANKIAMTLDAGTAVTVCASGCTITDNSWQTGGWQYAAGAVCGSGAVAAGATMDLDYFGFLATVGGR